MSQNGQNRSRFTHLEDDFTTCMYNITSSYSAYRCFVCLFRCFRFPKLNFKIIIIICVGVAIVQHFFVRKVSIPHLAQTKHGLNDTLKPRLVQMEHESKHMLNPSLTQMEHERHARKLRLAVKEYERRNTRYVLRQHSAKELERISNENNRRHLKGKRVIGISKLISLGANGSRWTAHLSKTVQRRYRANTHSTTPATS